MCGRYTITAEVAVLETRFEAQMTMPDYQPRFNAAPSQYLPVILHQAPNQIVAGKWGFRPQWAQNKPEIKPQLNARAETAAEKPMFRGAFKTNRCLILADGFYEWRRTGGEKAPYRVTLIDAKPFAMAGLWSEMKTADGDSVVTFTVLTTQANDCMSKIHTRMPVILAPTEQVKWLDLTLTRDVTVALLEPYPTDQVQLYPVSTAVNNTRHDHPDLIRPI